MKTDEYGEVINSDETYQDIGGMLHSPRQSVMVGWSDGDGTHYDILFTFTAKFVGGLKQGGIRSNDLFVSVMRVGCFGFATDHTVSAEYVNEKIGMVRNLGSTAQKLADLINGVKKYL